MDAAHGTLVVGDILDAYGAGIAGSGIHGEVADAVAETLGGGFAGPDYGFGSFCVSIGRVPVGEADDGAGGALALENLALLAFSQRRVSETR